MLRQFALQYYRPLRNKFGSVRMRYMLREAVEAEWHWMTGSGQNRNLNENSKNKLRQDDIGFRCPFRVGIEVLLVARLDSDLKKRVTLLIA